MFQHIARATMSMLPKRLNGFVLRAVKDFVPDSIRARAGLLDAEWSLRNAAAHGLMPGAIVDVGANQGRWSLAVSDVFPHAKVLMIEANADCEKHLAGAVAHISDARYEISLLGPQEDDSVPFFQMHEGSSVLPELTDIPREQVRLRMRTLDNVVAASGLPSPILLKLDVQGYELKVLEGGPETLSRASAVFMEVSFIPYNEGAPLFADSVAYMHHHGFVVYDLCSTVRRASDGALFQSDVLFVRENSPVRKTRPFFN